MCSVGSDAAARWVAASVIYRGHIAAVPYHANTMSKSTQRREQVDRIESLLAARLRVADVRELFGEVAFILTNNGLSVVVPVKARVERLEIDHFDDVLEVVERVCGIGVPVSFVHGVIHKKKPKPPAPARRSPPVPKAPAVQLPSPPPTDAFVMETFRAAISSILHIDTDGFYTRSRLPRLVMARSMLAYLCRKYTTYSYPELARRLRRRSHSSLVTEVVRIENGLRSHSPIRHIPDVAATTVPELLKAVQRKASHRLGEHWEYLRSRAADAQHVRGGQASKTATALPDPAV